MVARTTVGVVGALVLLAGCAAIEREAAQSTEQLLAAAGFQQRIADTPEQLSALQAMPQDTLVRHEVDGGLRYTYADAEVCKCLYAGNEASYDEFQKLSTQTQIAEMNQAASMNWEMWGPWGDGFY